MNYTSKNVPGVTTQVEAAFEPEPRMNEDEYELCAVLLVLTIGTEPPFNFRSAAMALEECYGYSQYESTPMMWDTLEEAGRRMDG